MLSLSDDQWVGTGVSEPNVEQSMLTECVYPVVPLNISSVR